MLQGFLHKSTHPPKDPMRKYNHYSHLTDEETESSEGSLAFPRSSELTPWSTNSEVWENASSGILRTGTNSTPCRRFLYSVLVRRLTHLLALSLPS